MAVGLGEVVILVGFAAAAFGRRDVPLLARAAGTATGRAVGFLVKARAAAMRYVQESQLTELHQEVSHGVRELHTIQDELRTGLRFFSNPMSMSQGLARQAAGRGLQPPPHMAPGAGGAGPAPPQAAAAPQPPPPQPQLEQRSWRDAAEGMAAMPTGAGALTPLPVSAVAAGLAKKWGESSPTGADILLDALYEEEVGRKAAALFRDQGMPVEPEK